MYTPVPGFEELQAEFHDALPGLVNGAPDWTDRPMNVNSVKEEEPGDNSNQQVRTVVK
jgi:hypothetical protein